MRDKNVLFKQSELHKKQNKALSGLEALRSLIFYHHSDGYAQANYLIVTHHIYLG